MEINTHIIISVVSNLGGSASKNKGNGAERELAKFLGDVFQAPFMRVQGSGAFVGGTNAFRKQSMSKNQIVSNRGDIVPPDHMPRFVVEAKFYASFRFHQLVQPKACTQLEEWITQCLDAIDDDDFWVIAFKINLIGWHIAVPLEFADAFLFENYATYQGPQGGFIVTELKSFFLNNKDAVEALSADFYPAD